MRSGKTALLAVSVPKEFLATIEEMRWRHRKTRSSYVYEALKQYIKDNEQHSEDSQNADSHSALS